MISKILIIYFSSFLIFYPISFADEKVATLRKGDAAPFSGTLFNTEAAARLLTELEFTQVSCQIETDRQVKIQAAQFQLKIDNVTASLNASNQRYDQVLIIKNDQILFLDDQLKKANPNNKVLWFALGIVGGVAVTATAGWTMGQINP
jgi:hypothetical protein